MRRMLDQMALLWLTDLRIWLRTPKHIVLSFVFAAMFLVVGTRMLTVQFGPHVCLGIVTKKEGTARQAMNEFQRVNVGVLRYDTLDEARRDLDASRISGVITMASDDFHSVHLTFSGRDPSLDREVSVLLLRAAARVTSGPVAGRALSLDHNCYTFDRMTTHIVASLLPFLILALASVNCGLFWLQGWERGTLFRYLLAPVPRSMWIVSRMVSNIVFTFVTVMAAVLVCRPFIAWHLPADWPAWIGVMAVQVFFAAGFFFVLAAWCKQHVLYGDLSVLLVFLLMFMSGALSPVLMLSHTERMIAACTPTFYAIRAMRAVLGGIEPVQAIDVAVPAVWGAACFLIGCLRVVNSQVEKNS